MNVLSLFNGMSCGQIALKELGAHVERYYASEVDKFAIAQTQLNFPETVQLGDVRNIDACKLGHVDLLLGGSPCQSFSFAGLTGGGYMIADEHQPDGRIRRLTPTECARLQTIPDWYKWECSNTQQYKMQGNGWTVEVIKHVLSFLPKSMLRPENIEAV